MKWPIMLFSIPFAAVLFGIVMVTTTLYFPDDVVADDYYKDGMAINQKIRADELAKALQLNAVVSNTDSQLFVDVDRAVDESIDLSFHHVTDRDRDFHLRLTRSSGRSYVAHSNIGELERNGVWYLKIEGVDQDWRLKKRITTPFNTIKVSSHD